MTVNIGFVTQLGTPLGDSIRAAGEYDFDYVEILMDGNDHRTRLATDTDEIEDALTETEVGVMVHLPFPVDVGGPHPHVREGGIAELTACIDTAIEIGANKGVVHPATTAWSSAWAHEDLRPGIREALGELQEFAADRGFELCAENIPGKPYSITEFPDLLAAVDVSMTLDTGHAYLSGYDATEMAQFVADHPDRVTHLHLNDNNGRSDTHLPLGAGAIDFERFFIELPPEWEGTASVEVATNDLQYIGESKRRIERVALN